MFRGILILHMVLSALKCFSQPDFNGLWQGFTVQKGLANEKGNPFYLNIVTKGSVLTGQSREEYFETTQMAIKAIKGSSKGQTINITQGAIETSANIKGKNLCAIDIVLTWNETTGYLEGTYISPTCRSVMGKIILFRSTAVFSKQEEPLVRHNWFNRFIIDLKKGYASPEYRKKERDAFVFQTVYFDYDSFTIDAKYNDYLKKMARIIDGHSDLRVLVTGHTDADGSNQYNIDLSKKRAQSIIHFFELNGIDSSRIQIDFKGETQPVDSNTTPEGKKRNRRVDFVFI